MARKPKPSGDKPLFPLLPETEVEAYAFIRRQLGELGWVVKNPNLSTGGQVWTQNQCLGHPEIKAALGAKRPENIVKISETQLWVIESKASRSDLDLAVNEAIGYYAGPLNERTTNLRAILATGVAGTAECYS